MGRFGLTEQSLISRKNLLPPVLLQPAVHQHDRLVHNIRLHVELRRQRLHQLVDPLGMIQGEAVRDPRAPVGMAMRLLPRLSVRDLKVLVQDRNVAHTIRSGAKRFYTMKQG